ncbi:unnamed protein product [Lasius platythorax]|uniref:Uncharacterized protein n=1 Tax=Lasius platythorax TaxID=488582 RepID=A0AAV2MXV3_9HYME
MAGKTETPDLSPPQINRQIAKGLYIVETAISVRQTLPLTDTLCPWFESVLNSVDFTKRLCPWFESRLNFFDFTFAPGANPG